MSSEGIQPLFKSELLIVILVAESQVWKGKNLNDLHKATMDCEGKQADPYCSECTAQFTVTLLWKPAWERNK